MTCDWPMLAHAGPCSAQGKKRLKTRRLSLMAGKSWCKRTEDRIETAEAKPKQNQDQVGKE
ncbi:hypothetical protein SV7mr_19660 [Stieleria bergensis]|uniref:Uncharacterized protein n=1 Tax=Stieleria bergensis TaxID=2528025 RepID=A0A517STK8_9BACT|nr:hypothetical protein SV7mr_19660 [Planctomycetes bacterium SV_7m_r]